MSIYVVHPQINLLKLVAERIAERLEKSVKAFLVFPHRRAMAFFRYYFAQVAGTPCLLPQMRAFEDWVAEVYICSRMRSETPINRWDQAWLIWQAAKEVLGSERYPFLSSWESFFGWGLRLADFFKELDLELVEPRDIEYSFSLSEQVRLFAQNLGRIYQVFDRLLKNGGYTTPSRMVKTLAAEGFEPPGSEVHVVGFYALTRAESRIFKRLFEEGAVFWWYADPQSLPPLYERWKKEWGLSTRDLEPVVPEGPSKPELFFYECHSLHSELEQLRAILGEDGFPEPDKKALVLLDQRSLIPVLYSLEVEPINVTMGYPLSFSGLYGFFRSIFRLLSRKTSRGYRTEDVLEFLKSPYSGDPDELKKLRSWLLERGFFFVNGEIFKQRSDLEKIFEWAVYPFERAETPKQFASALLEVLKKIFSTEPFRKDEAIEKFFALKVLDEVIPIFENGLFCEERMSLKGLFSLFDSVMRNVSVPFEGEPLTGLQVMGLLETRLLKFDEVILLDANDDIIPGAEEVNPVAPEEVRAALRLPPRYDEEAITGYHFRRLVDSARRVHILWQSQSAPDRNGFETKKIKSRYVEALIWELQREKTAKAEKKLERVPDVGVKRTGIKISPEILKKRELLRKTEGHLKKLTEKLKEALSPSDLDLYLFCPLKFYYSKLLKLMPRSEISELEPAELGTALHEAFKEFYKNFVGKKVRKENLDEEKLFKLFEQKFKATYLLSPAKKFLLAETVRFRIRKYIENQPEETFIEAVEREFRKSLKNAHISGRADRIDRRPLGDFEFTLILDYKTGRHKVPLKKLFSEEITLSPDHESLKKLSKLTGGSVQLLLYTYLYLESKKDKMLISAAFVDMKRTGEEKHFCDLKSDAIALFTDWVAEAFPDILNGLIRHMLESEFWYPASDESNCRFCEFRSICRFTV